MTWDYISALTPLFVAEYDLLAEEFPSAPHGKLAALALCSESVSPVTDGPIVAHYLDREGVDHSIACSVAGPIVVQQVRFDRRGIFSFAIDGDPALVSIVNGEDAETPIDLVAWSAAEPARFGTYFGNAGVLGADLVVNPASYSSTGFLECHRTPLAWLKAACRGCVVLRAKKAQPLLVRRLGPVMAADRRHAEMLLSRLAPALSESDVFIRIPDDESLAA
jgi:hypothetical protein